MINSDVNDVLLAEFGVSASFSRGNTEGGEDVKVYVSPAAAKGIATPRMIGSAQTKSTTFALMVKALGTTESIAPTASVGDQGGIRELSEQDAFVVPASAINKGPVASGTVRVVVIGGVKLVSGMWHCEVRP